MTKPTELALAALNKYLEKNGTPRAMTIWVNADGTYTLPNVGQPRPFIPKYWTFISFETLHTETGYTFLAIDANEGKSNARFPLFVIDTYETEEAAARGSKMYYSMEKRDSLLDAALELLETEKKEPTGQWVIRVSGNKLAPPIAEWIEE